MCIHIWKEGMSLNIKIFSYNSSKALFFNILFDNTEQNKTNLKKENAFGMQKY